MNQKQALAAARKKLGKTAMVQHWPRALTEPEKKGVRLHLADVKAEQAAADAVIKSHHHGQAYGHLKALLAAAEFAVDVNGDNPSLPQLAEAVGIVRDYVEANRVYRDCREEIKTLSGKLHSHRCDVGTNLSFAFHVYASGDTWQEAIDRLNGKD